MTKKSRGKLFHAKMDEDSDEDTQEKVIVAEERLMSVLSPIESYIMSFQALLVWEKPEQSAVLLIGVNVLFWLATTMRIYYLIGITGVVISFSTLWSNYIWPEIRVPPPPGSDEDWIPVHPKMLSVPEICHYAAEWWVYLADKVSAAVKLRKANHAKFFVQSLITLSLLAVAGHYVRGISVAYFTVMGLLLLPCVIYHNLLSRAYEHLQPYMMSVEQRLNIKRKRSKRSKKRGGEQPQQLSDEPGEEDSDSDDEHTREFIRSAQPELSEQLANADSESETEYQQGLLTPPQLPSRTPSRDDLLHSDDESHTETVEIFTPSLSMPSLDQVDCSLTDLNSLPDLRAETEHQLGATDLDLTPANITTTEDEGEPTKPPAADKQEKMQFVSSHFKESSEEDETESMVTDLAEGLDIPGIDNTIDAVDSSPSAQLQFLSAALQNSQAVTQTVSSLMTSTLSGLSQLRSSVMAATNRPHVVESADHTEAVDAEFEFLSQEDLEDSLHEEGLDDQ